MAGKIEVLNDLDMAIQTVSIVRREVSFRYNEIEILRKIDSFILNSKEGDGSTSSAIITGLFQSVIGSLNRDLISGGVCAFYVNLDSRFELIGRMNSDVFPAVVHCDAGKVDWKKIEISPLHLRPEGEPFVSVFPKATAIYTEPLFIFDDVLLGVFVVQETEGSGAADKGSNWLLDDEHIDTLRGVFRQLKIAYRYLVEHRRSASLNDLWGEFAEHDFSPHFCLNLLARRLVEMSPELGPMKLNPVPEVQILFSYGSDLRILATTGRERDTQFVSVSDSISGLAFTESRMLNVDPLSDDYVKLYKNYLGRDRKMRSELVVPMRSRGNVVGVVNLESTQLSAFSTVQARTLMEIVEKITPVALALKARLDHNREAQSAYSSIMAEYLRRFSGVLRHELASPTSALKSNIININKRLEIHNINKEDLFDEVETAKVNYEKISHSVFDFIEDLSTYGEIQPICINDLVQESVGIINDTSRPNIGELASEKYEFKIKIINKGKYKVKASRLLKPYLVCLLDNSIRSIKQKRKLGKLKGAGSILILIEKDEIESGNILITLKDNGEGVNKKELKLLKRFRVGTRFREDKGQGYGLAATQRYLTEVGGWIDLESVKGKNFQVMISLKHEQ